MVLKVAETTNTMIDYKACYMCAIIAPGITIEKEVREKGVEPQMMKYTLASAIVQNSLAHKILANFIIRIQRPPAPTKTFTTLHDALNWFDTLRAKNK